MKKKFKPALNGFALALKDKGICTQFILACFAVVTGFIMHLNVTEWLFVILAIGLVITAEILNTAIEKICNFIQPEKDERIREIKDLAAAAVLFSSIIALFIAFIILFTHI